MPLQCSIYADAPTFLATAGKMLYARETVNNLILGVSECLVADPKVYKNPFFATVEGEDGNLILAAVMTPPHNLILAGDARVEEGFPALIDHLSMHHVPIPGVIAPAEIADEFLRAWERRVGEVGDLNRRMRVYELRQVQTQIFPPGTFQVAGPLEIPIIAKWVQAFEAEALGESHELDLARAERLITGGQIFTWMVEEETVSMAMKTRPIAHSITIGGVYTPPEHRRLGYAGALVANLSQYLLHDGYQFVNLFTDLDNPTSNKIYMAVGYHPVCDFREYRFKGLAT
ncbi:MAG: GNAT family N-acetyltransferase [Brevefilum sp.]|nr:GNAT family N-acetyltransferase [Brevefilum sp.]